VYTSGAEGVSQGVMLSHRNLTWTADVVSEILHIDKTDTSLSYLPLAHVSEQLFTVHGPICTGSTVYYAESTRRAPANLREVQPTVLFGVPRIWEKMQAGLAARLTQVHGPRARILSWARAVATRAVRTRCEGKEPSVELAAQYELANSLVLDKLRRALGLGRARVCLSGAAPIDPDTLNFFASLGLALLEVYGQTESSGPITLNQPRRARFGSPGPKLPGLTLTIAEDGELLVSGPNVFVGYQRNPHATAQALAGGVLHTGDLARIDAEGFLVITGRKREILVTAGGKNIAPTRLEAALMRDELIRDAVVIGDRRRFLSALVTIDEEVAAGLGLSGHLHENEVVRERVARAIEALNSRVGGAEQLRRHAILPRNFLIETGELTPTMKLRRQRIEELWAKEIDALYVDVVEPTARV
jgi:long-chain acyl-CoA synthetase